MGKVKNLLPDDIDDLFDEIEPFSGDFYDLDQDIILENDSIKDIVTIEINEDLPF